jgi:hypothetical protein
MTMDSQATVGQAPLPFKPCEDSAMNAESYERQTSGDRASGGHFCIFCDNELHAQTRPEHVLLNALGGRMTTRLADCSHHNNLFGSGIDKSLADQVAMLRNMFQMESGDGKPSPSIRNIQAGNTRINLDRNGRPEPISPPFSITKNSDGTSNVQIAAASEEKLREIVPHLAAALRMDKEVFEQLLMDAEGKLVYKRVDPIHFHLAAPGPQEIRSFVKSCLVLLATRVGTDLLRRDPFAEARKFVLQGGHDFCANRTSLDLREFPSAAYLEKRYGLLYNLIYVASDAAGRTIGHFTLYNLHAWQIVLAEHGGPPNLQIGLISNPLNPADRSDLIAEEIDIDFEWLKKPDANPLLARGHERLRAAMEMHGKMVQEQEFAREKARILTRFLQSAKDLMSDKDSWLRECQRIADLMARVRLNLPYEEPFEFTPTKSR